MANLSERIFHAADFAQAFRRERKIQGKTQQWVADQAGIRRETVVALEQGENVGLHYALAMLGTLGKALCLTDSQLPSYEEIREFFSDDDDDDE